MSAMIDTMVLIYAVHHRLKRVVKDAALRQMLEASELLFSQLKPVRISVISWTEALRTARKDELDFLLSLSSSIEIVPLDIVMTETAARLLRKRGGDPALCPECLQPKKGGSACGRCARVKSPKFATNDALIVATASELEEVTTLYSFDGGVHLLGKYAENCIIMRPPHAVGPLFDPLENPQHLAKTPPPDVPASALPAEGAPTQLAPVAEKAGELAHSQASQGVGGSGSGGQ